MEPAETETASLQRLHALERQLRRWKVVSVLAAVVAACSLLLTVTRAPGPTRSTPEGWVSARGYAITNADGVEVGGLGELPAGGGAALTLGGPGHPSRVMISGDQHQGSIVLHGDEPDYLIMQPTSGMDGG